MYNSRGAIHIHTRFSDGSGTLKTISKAAKHAGLDWIIITDHNRFDIDEGIFNGVYVIRGEEISPPSSYHYIVIDTNKNIMPEESIQNTVQKVRNLGGFGFAAHPDESDFRNNTYLPIKWVDKNIIPDGIEIWNWFSQWGDKYDNKNIFTKASSVIFKHSLIKAPYPQTLEWWDNLNQKYDKIIPAIGGVDAHAMKIYNYIIPLTIFPYKDLFKTVQNIINTKNPLSENFEIAKQQILTAVKNGQNMVVNRHISKKIPEICIENSHTKIYCGGNIKLEKETYLNVNFNQKVEIKIILDGQLITEKIGENLRMQISKTGKYRIEITKNGKGFVYSNPFLVY